MNDIIRIANINNYHLEIINNELILTPINNYITEDELYNKNLKYSKVNYCLITDNTNNIISNNSNNYSSILADIYKSMSASIILQNTTFNIKLTNEAGRCGYIWNSNINMSIQGKDTIGTLKEIIKMVILNNYNIHINIKLANGEIINYKTNLR